MKRYRNTTTGKFTSATAAAAVGAEHVVLETIDTRQRLSADATAIVEGLLREIAAGADAIRLAEEALDHFPA